MTSIAVAGGPARLESPESNLVVAGATPVRVEYAAFSWSGTYRIALAPARLTAVISKTDEGFVAVCPELNALGYGPEPKAAVEDLTDAVREYLTFLAEKHPALAPHVAHHDLYVGLLSAPEASWFAAIKVPSNFTADAA